MAQLRVPLLVRPAGGTEGRVVATPSSGVDVAPTILALAGLEASEEDVQRRQWAENLLEIEDNPKRPILVEDLQDVGRMCSGNVDS